MSEYKPYKSAFLNSIYDTGEIGQALSQKNSLGIESLTDRQKMIVNLMRKEMGYGLAANQVGLPLKVFVLDGEPAYAVFNPRITYFGEEEILLEEGCLSYPDKFINIQRPDKIIVMYEDEEGKEHKIKLEGFPSRVFQHEYDHLEGIDFTQRQ